MTSVIEAVGLTKSYRETIALNDVSIGIRKDAITGLLGRNGAGKSTLMSIITAQNFASAGTVRVFGEQPYEHASVLSRMCFVRESQRYPDDFTPGMAFRAAAMFFANWDQALADELVARFQLPMNRRIKKRSRGQLSAVGVIIGIASRAEITFFDEPYLGLDAVARQIFYDRLLADYTDHPRTIVLSSHLIDEVANLLEHVIVLEGGRVIIDDDAAELQHRAFTLVGAASAVDAFTSGREVLHRDVLGPVASVTVLGAITDSERDEAAARNLDVGPVSLQQLLVRLSQHEADRAATARKEVVR